MVPIGSNAAVGVCNVRTDAQYVLPTEPTEDIESVNLESEEIVNHKFIRDGQLLIEHNGRVYTLTGQVIE